MTNLFDALEFCLREVEEGGDMETALKRFPEYADELRPILETSVKARAMAVPEPAPEVVRRSRARVMQRAAELRETKATPTRRQGASLFQRFALSFALAAIFLLSGNGLLSASASALPGERLYPVKRGWENVRLFFIFDSEARELLEDEFENERLHEVNELLAEGRHEVIDFAGVFMQVNGVTYISGLQVILPANVTIPPNGTAVLVSGSTNASGFIEVLTFELLPEGSVVPSGSPIEVDVEDESSSNGESAPETEPAQTSGNEAGGIEPKEVEMLGNLRSVSTTSLVINNLTVYIDSAEVKGTLCVGAQVEVKGYYAGDGRFVATRVESKGGCEASGSSSGSGGNENQNSSSGSNQNTNNNSSNGNSNENTNSNDNSNDDKGGDDNSNDDNSGSGGGGDDDD